MFRSLRMTRFRGFRDLEVKPLDRFNLCLGSNNVGKTALLEGAFLLMAPTNPELPLRVNAFRGIDLLRKPTTYRFIAWTGMTGLWNV